MIVTENDFKQLSLSDYLKDRLSSLKTEHSSHMGTGNLKDFSEYKRMAGIIEGLSLAERELADWIDRHTRE